MKQSFVVDKGFEDFIRDTSWDVVVLGSGVGGAVVSCALAEQGKKVLILEKGPLPLASTELSTPASLPLWTESVLDSGSKRACFPFLGEGAGGSSRLFGMVMEALEPSDFEAEGGAWPGSLKEWLPWYEQAEALFSVRQTPSIPEFSPLLERIRSQGLETKPLRLAYLGNKDCEYCQSAVCARHCKVDAWTGPLSRALRTENAFLATEIEGMSLVQKAGNVIGVRCKTKKGKTLEVKAKQFVLAAGALKSPLILMRSDSLQSEVSFHDLEATGRYFMRHFLDLYILRWPEWKQLGKEKKDLLARAKNWGCDSLYQKNGLKLGTFQSLGRLPDFEHMWSELTESKMRWARRNPLAKVIAKKVIGSLFQHPVVSSIIEDTPNAANRVEEKPGGGIVMTYQVSPQDREKIATMRTLLQEIFGPYLLHMEEQAFSNFRLAHACGTCRMGSNQRTSVVDAYGKVHFAENLWVADASVFPSSTGKNPALTIAAHSLRLANRLAPLS